MVGSGSGSWSGVGQWRAGTGADLVNEAERAICGQGAVSSGAHAEGIAVADERAATLLAAGRRGEALLPRSGPRPLPWVHHRVIPGGKPAGTWGNFELEPADAQEAVDHCLVAHRLAELTGRPGCCSLPEHLAYAPDVARVPESSVVREWLGAVLHPPSDKILDGVALDLVALANRSFSDVSRWTGRAVDAVSAYRTEDASVLLVSRAGGAASMRVAVDLLRAGGCAAGAVCLSLLRPFPRAAVRAAALGATTVAIFSYRSDGAAHDEVLDGAAAAVAGRAGEERSVHALSCAGGADSPAVTAARKVAALVGLDPAAIAPASASEARQFVVGFAPGGAAAEAWLSGLAARIHHRRRAQLFYPSNAARGASILGLRAGFSPFVTSESAPGRAEPAELDLLVATHQRALPASLLARLRSGGTVLLLGEQQSAEQAWHELDAAQRAALRARAAEVRWLPTEARADAIASGEEALRALSHGAAMPVVEGALGAPDAATGGAGGDALQRFVDAGRAAAVAITADVMAAEPPSSRAAGTAGAEREPCVTLPAPAGDENGSAVDWELHVRRFYSSGTAVPAKPEAFTPRPIIPAVAMALCGDQDAHASYPYFLPAVGAAAKAAAEVAPQPLAALLETAIAAASSAGHDLSFLQLHRARLLAAIARTLAERESPDPVDVTVAFDRGCQAFTAAIDVSERGSQLVREGLAAVRAQLPAQGCLVGLDAYTVEAFYSAALNAVRREAVARVISDACQIEHALDRLLSVDRALDPEALSPAAVADGLGGGGLLFDPAALSSTLPRKRGSRRMPERLREMVSWSYDTIQSFLARFESDIPDCVLVHSGNLSRAVRLPANAMLEHADPFGAAIGVYDGWVAHLSDLFRALRFGRKVAAGTLDLDAGPAPLPPFRYETCSPDELLLVPPVVVVEQAESDATESLSSLSSLLRSGRPIHVLLTQSMTANDGGSAAAPAHHAGLGFTAVAHREAFIVQSNLATPGHLLRGLLQLVVSSGPAAALIGEPAWDEAGHPQVLVAAGHHARALPSFVYDPAKGESWATRFDLAENPDPELLWPRKTLSYLDGDGQEATLEVAFTFADAVALSPRHRDAFWVIPRAAWSDKQVPLADFVAATEESRAATIPFIWVVDERQQLQRAIVRWTLAYKTRDRMRTWRLLQELGGYQNVHAQRAAAATKEVVTAEAESERRRLLAAHEAEVAAVKEAAITEAVERMVAVLLDSSEPLFGGAGPAVSFAPPAVSIRPAAELQPQAPAPEAAVAVTAAPEPEPESELSFDQPYIESALCSSCNDCVKLNPLMFKYNDNRQAYLADTSAGTFAQLVEAAEKCPARCIHPGKPQGAAQVSPELLARAAVLN
ncbi:MAG: ferredoxin [Candidatus Schekmanbacteria bacterium]|nr:ferredoxin [Candidatus Schekmanbacteria bacterium]